MLKTDHLLKFLNLSKSCFGRIEGIQSSLPFRNVELLYQRIGGIDLGQQLIRHQAKRLQDSLGSSIIMNETFSNANTYKLDVSKHCYINHFRPLREISRPLPAYFSDPFFS